MWCSGNGQIYAENTHCAVPLWYERGFGVFNLNVIPLKKFAGGVLNGSEGDLIADLGVDEREIRSGKLRLRIQKDEKRLDAEVEFPLLRVQILLGKVTGNFRSRHGKFGLFKRMDSVAGFELNRLQF